ncbi:MAG: outer membrane protein assembly factor BamD [Myxococcales bacterium]|nr:outer membrane protein assembly factor BamD [Myxococcales bacterium]
MTDPKRLIGDANEDEFVKSLLRGGINDAPSPAVKAEALKLALEAGGGGAAASSTGASATLKWWLVGGVGLALVGAAVWSATSTSTSNITGRSPEGTESSHVDGSVRTLVTSTSTSTPTPTSTSTSTSRTPTPTPKPVASGAPADLAQEILALDKARQALKSQGPAAALLELGAYDRAFPQGTLRQEADLLRIEARVANGDMTEARRLGDNFQRKHPGSAHARRVRSLLGERDGGE